MMSMALKGIILFLIGCCAMLALGWFVFPRLLYTSVEQPVQFNHRLHAGESIGQTCEDCHFLRSDGTFAGLPAIEKCAACHTARIGATVAESLLVVNYIIPNQEIPWLVYARQPENVYFSHVYHIKLASISCDRCHGPHGRSESLHNFQKDRISGYSKDIWGSSIARIKAHEWDGMKMTDCSDCHHQRSVGESCIDCHK